MKKSGWTLLVALLATAGSNLAQTRPDEERMERDIKVAESVLSTLIRHHLQQKNSLFPLNVVGAYTEGYGVTLRLPGEMFWSLARWQDGKQEMEMEMDIDMKMDIEKDIEKDVIIERRAADTGGPVRRIITTKSLKEDDGEDGGPVRSITITGKPLKKDDGDDTATGDRHERMVEAAKNFLADYGDLLSQLKPQERIVITNRHEHDSGLPGWGGRKSRYLALEAIKGDLTQYRQGKISREQLFNKITVVNTEPVENIDPDLELLESIFSRLYRPDLSRTFFTQGPVRYERLKDFGAVLHMQVYSANVVRDNGRAGEGSRLYDMPTLKLQKVDKATRDAKVKEMYPLFEAGLKENLLEYGRTVKSLGANELLVVKVKLTQCEQCGIPASLELALKGAVLADYASGKIGREAALAKVTVKKGALQ